MSFFSEKFHIQLLRPHRFPSFWWAVSDERLSSNAQQRDAGISREGDGLRVKMVDRRAETRVDGSTSFQAVSSILRR